MNEDYMESLARAYNVKLNGSEHPLITQIIDILNEQIYLLSRLSHARKVVGYVISLQECVKGMLTENKNPSPRHLPREGDTSKILALQIELFTLLDQLDHPKINKIQEYENRALSLICYLGK